MKTCRRTFKMAKDKKQIRPKAITPKGFRDYFGSDVTERNQMLQKIAEIYDSYGFEALESSAVETVEALGKFLPDIDQPNEGVFAWQEDDQDWLALRYDLTAPLARVYAQYRNELPTPYRRYSMGPVWRNEKPGPGRFRQFYQCDADTVGSASIAADSEICMLLSDTLEYVGISKGDYIIKTNNRKVLNGVLESMNIQETSIRDAILRTVDKFDKVGESGIRQLLGKGRLDSSGAYIDGVNLSDTEADVVVAFLTSKGSNIETTLSNLKNLIGSSDIGLEGVNELETMAELFEAGGYGSSKISIDPSVVRGLGYYTGPVYEAELTFEIFDEKGRKRQFGSVSGGGRYDDLVKRFTGQSVPATGVSIGVDRLLAALKEKGRVRGSGLGPVVVTVMDRDRIGDYQEIVTELRKAGIRSEVYLGNPKNFGNQLKYADNRSSPAAVIEGTEERESGTIQIKDLILGKKLSEEATLEEWKDRPSQFTVRKDELVQKIREILSAYK